MALEKVGVRAVVEGLGPYEQGAKKVSAAQQRMGASAEAASKKSGLLSGALKTVGTVAAGFIAARAIMAAPQILGAITNTARDLELQMRKANVVFGEQITVVKKWASESAKAMGLSRAQAVNLAASMGDLLIPMGFAREEAAAMATETLNLAGALAEWSGGMRSTSEVADILTKAMLGEREQLKTLGISITEAEVKTRLLEKGQADLTGEAEKQARAIASQELIFEKSTDAQAAYADGAGTAARTQAEMTAQVQEAKEAISLALAPAISGLITLLATGLVPALKAGTKFFEVFVSASEEVAKTLAKNKDLLIAFGAVAIGAILIPALLSAITIFLHLGEVIRAVAIARHMTIMSAALRTLTLPTIGLPALAIGAIAAGLALFGLARHFLGARSEAEKMKDAERALNEELEETARIAELRGLDVAEARLRRLGEQFLENERNLAPLRQGIKQFQDDLRATHPELSAERIELVALISLGKDLRKEFAALSKEHKVLAAAGKELAPSLTEITQLAADLGVPLHDLVVLFPELGEAAEQAGQPVGEFAEKNVAALTEEFDKQIESITALADALENKYAAALRKLATPTTREERQLEATIADYDAKIARIEALAAFYSRELTPAEEKQIEALEGERDRLGEVREAIDKTQEAEGLRLAVLAGGLITMEEYDSLIEETASHLEDEAGAAERAQISSALLGDALSKVAAAGAEDFAQNLRDFLIPQVVTATDRILRLNEAVSAGRFRAAPGAAPILVAPGRQFGGPVQAGAPVLVGERGAEIFVPPATGTVLSSPASFAMGGAARAAMSVSAPFDININVQGLDWISVRRTVHAEVDEALDAARSRTERSGALIGAGIG